MGSRHRAATDSVHSARKVLVRALVLVAIIIIAVALYRVATGKPLLPCGGSHPVTLAADPSISEEIEQLVAESGGDGCTSYEVESTSTGAMLRKLADRKELPDLWIPTSTVQSDRVSRDSQLPFETVLNSVASTPVVLAVKDGDPSIRSWTEALGTPGMIVDDVADSGVADGAMLAAAAEREAGLVSAEQVQQSLAVLAQGQRPSNEGLVDQLATTGGVAVVTEQELSARGEQNEADGIRIQVPVTGANYLSFPLVITAQDPGRRDDVREAAQELADEATDDDFANTLADAGFRTADRAPLEGDVGVGETERLVVRDPGALDEAVREWRLMSMPTNSLALVDSSGSMALDVPTLGSTRMGMMVQTLTRGLEYFSDSSSLGLWAFNAADPTRAEPYVEVQPLGGLSGPSASGAQGTHRDDLVSGLASLPEYVGGATELYSTVLAAYRSVLDSYDPNAINTIMVFSDGANDAADTIGRDEFFNQLREMQDPQRPVKVVTIGVLDDVDPTVLAEIAEATGGSSHISRTPEEIPQVFAAAIADRSAPA